MDRDGLRILVAVDFSAESKKALRVERVTDECRPVRPQSL